MNLTVIVINLSSASCLSFQTAAIGNVISGSVYYPGTLAIGNLDLSSDSNTISLNTNDTTSLCYGKYFNGPELLDQATFLQLVPIQLGHWI